jgi:hypothetical protein
MNRSIIALFVVALFIAVVVVECGPARGRRRARANDQPDVNDLFPRDGEADENER